MSKNIKRLSIFGFMSNIKKKKFKLRKKFIYTTLIFTLFMNGFVSSAISVLASDLSKEELSESFELPKEKQITEGIFQNVFFKMTTDGVLSFSEGRFKEKTKNEEDPFLNFKEKVKKIVFTEKITVEKKGLDFLQNFSEVTEIEGLENLNLLPFSGNLVDITEKLPHLDKNEKQKIQELLKSEEVVDKPKETVKEASSLRENSSATSSTEEQEVVEHKTDAPSIPEEPQDSSIKETSTFLPEQPTISISNKSPLSFGRKMMEKTKNIQLSLIEDYLEDNPSIHLSDEENVSQKFEPGGAATVNNQEFQLTKADEKNTKGYIILQNQFDLSKSFQMTGTFDVDARWKLESGLLENKEYANDGYGFLITEASPKGENNIPSIEDGAAGGTLGIYGLPRTLFAGIDTHRNDEEKGILEKDQIVKNNDSLLYYGGNIVLGNKKRQSVLKFLSNFEALSTGKVDPKAIVSQPSPNAGVATSIAYLPGKNEMRTGFFNDQLVQENESEDFEISWLPDASQSEESYTTGTLEVTFIGSKKAWDTNKYNTPRRTIKNRFTFKTNSSFGFISANGDATANVKVAVKTITYTPGMTDLEITYLTNDGNETKRVATIPSNKTFTLNDSTGTADYQFTLPSEISTNVTIEGASGVTTATGEKMEITVKETKPSLTFYLKSKNGETVYYKDKEGNLIDHFTFRGEVGEAFAAEDNEKLTGIILELIEDYDLENFQFLEDDFTYSNTPQERTIILNPKPEIKMINYIDIGTKKTIYKDEVKENYKKIDLYDFENETWPKEIFKEYVYAKDPFQKNGLSLSQEETEKEIYLQQVKDKGLWGTVKWYVDLEGILHLSGGKATEITATNNPFSKRIGFTKISIEGDFIAPKNANGLFNFSQEDVIEEYQGLEKVDMSQVMSMEWFLKLKPADKNKKALLTGYENWNVEKVEKADNAFGAVIQVEDYDFSHWKTTSLRDAKTMVGYTNGKYVNGVQQSNILIKSIKFGPDFTATLTFPIEEGKKWRNVADGTKENPQGENYFDIYTGNSKDADIYVVTNQKPEVPFENIIPMTGSKKSALMYGISSLIFFFVLTFIVKKEKREAREEENDWKNFLKK